ncbi:phosphoenolpyruvate carboxykinase [Candidatus Woesearchaeota archaeon]|nr:phosphoenolpyruvate carboxykinase [Candidatus Woesearchaeota archaeon]
MQALNKKTKEEIIQDRPEFEEILTKTYLFHQLIEEFYNYWRNYERYLVCLSENGANFDERPYRTFNDTISLMNDLVRKAYRDVCENLTGDHPTIYRQLSAGFQVGLIAVKKEWPCPENHSNLKNVPFIRQVLLNPPLIIDPFMNKRTGQFTRVKSNPLEGYIFDQREWMCYPAIVGDFLIHVYFHNKFIGLGCALSNLFQLANNADLKKQPDAVYAFGLPENRLHASCSPTIFYDEEEILFGAVPCSDNFGYFGYLKKMILTLHNILAMKKGRMPIHGAMVSIELKQGGNANVIILGDSGAGKSESLEAFRILGKEYIRDMTIIFDDMGSLDMKEGKIIAYGTEIGAFVRLDDLQPGFAFGNLDRSIIMSPQKINARAVLPVTNIEEVLRGYTVDYFLYANNYEKIDDKNPYLERFIDKEVAFEIFKKGAVMSKGTTTTTGLVSNYFANIFGPPQYQELHETIAKKFFDAMFENNLFIGQLRTQLGIQGKEITGPEEAAKALFRSIQDR